MLDLGARGLAYPTTTTYPLDQAVFSYQEMAAGRLVGRAVIVP